MLYLKIISYNQTNIDFVLMETHLEIYKSLRRLPRMLRDVAALQKAIFKGDKNP